MLSKPDALGAIWSSKQDHSDWSWTIPLAQRCFCFFLKVYCYVLPAGSSNWARAFKERSSTSMQPGWMREAFESNLLLWTCVWVCAAFPMHVSDHVTRAKVEWCELRCDKARVNEIQAKRRNKARLQGKEDEGKADEANGDAAMWHLPEAMWVVRNDRNKQSRLMNLSAALICSMCKAAMSASVKMALPGDPTNGVGSNCVRNPSMLQIISRIMSAAFCPPSTTFKQIK